MIDPELETERGIDARIEDIANHELPDHVADLVAEYDQHVGQRDRFLWKWIHAMLPHVTFSSVSAEYEQHARSVKTVASMFVVLVDDLGERDRDKATLEEASKIPFEWQTVNYDRRDVDTDVLGVADRIWTRVEDELARSPRRQEFADVFAFDLSQTLTAVEYSYLVNEHLAMANVADHLTYDCNNMMLFPYADVDLMFSPTFDRDDLSVVRRAVRRAQTMARIGNWVTTWERELDEMDFSSGVLVAALERGIVTRYELAALRNGAPDDAPRRIADRVRDRGLEEDLLLAWRRNHRKARDIVPETNSVDLDRYLDGMETVLQYHLASRGMK